MADQFIGLHMSVVLRDPAGYRLVGTVRDVEAGSSLTLTNVYIAATQERAAKMTIDAANIADLSEMPLGKASPTKYSAQMPAPAPGPALYASQILQTQPPPPQQETLLDPAILSVGKRPSSNPAPVSTLGMRGQSVIGIENRPDQAIFYPLQGLNVGHSGHSGDQTPRAAAGTPPQKKKGIRGKTSNQAHSKNGAGIENEEEDDGSSVNGHGKGWRQTPIIQSTASFQPYKSLKKNGKSRKGLPDNGWASEDVTEEMGEFDFENNLAKFDKRTVFDQIRKDDEIDESQRLVSHNRLPKPGTAGGKNYHYTEMVLDAQPALGGQNADFWNSEAEVAVNESGRLSGREARNGSAVAAAASAGSKSRAESKSGPSRRSQSRKASGIVSSEPISRVNSSHRIEQPGLYLTGSRRRLEAISTLQMLNLENIAANELGFSEALMAENAGRGIAEVAVTALSDPAIKVRFELALANSAADSASSSSLGAATIVILAGNNKSGIRALAAARHLRNKNYEVLVCLVGVERDRDLLEDLRRQMQLYRAFGGKVHGKNDFFEHLRKSSASGSPISVSLIIDALLGLTISFDELRIGDQATVYELMEWANRNEAFALSVDVPTGIDPSSGKIAVIDGAHLYLKPRYVVAIGAPKKGLLEAVTPPRGGGERSVMSAAASEDGWRLFIADMGLGSAVWKKAGTKIRRGVDFDGKWVLEMRFRGVGERVGEDG